MPSPFLTAGGAPDKPSRFAPLYVNRFFSGLYTNSNPLSEAAVPYLYQKFYAGARYETLRGGVNVEVSPRLTLVRRPGLTVYNGNGFNNVQTFYSFRVFNPFTNTTQIRVIVDSTGIVRDGTAPNLLNLRSKLAGAGQTSFQTLGNVLYAADGVSSWKWVWAPSWTSNTTYPVGSIILDQNNNIQQAQGLAALVTSTSVTSNVITVGFAGSATVNVGDTWEFFGMTGNPSLNGQSVVVLTVGVGTFTASYQSANYSALDSGIIVNVSSSGISSPTIPSFPTSTGAVILDNTVGWLNKGPSVQNIGIVAPQNAPIVSNVFYGSGTAWVASTYYWPEINGTAYPLIIDSNSNIQELTTAGTTASSIPSWNTSGTTTDGSATWTFQGQAARQTSHTYTVGAFIAVTVTTQYSEKDPIFSRNGQIIGYKYTYYNVSNFYYFVATVGGKSSSLANTSIHWPSTLGGTVQDGAVTWMNCGYQVTHTNASSSSPSNSTQGNLTTSCLAAITSTIVDNLGSGSGTGYTQNCTVAGKSGASHPTWATTGGNEAAGLVTNDNGIQWTNGGPAGVANTANWYYGFSFGNSVTGHESSMSPASVGVILAAQSAISVSGNGDPNYASDGYDTINIYRTVQGTTSPFFRLASINAPLLGAPWQYVDNSPDPPNPTSRLNELISADTSGNNAPPPAGITNFTYYLNRLFASSGTIQSYSGVANQPVGVGAESWPGLNFWQMPEVVSVSWASATGLLIFTVHGVYFSQGVDGNGNPLTPVKILEDIGLLSPNLFTVNGSIPTILTADSQLLTLDPSAGVSRLSDPIADILAKFSNSGSYLTWHTNGIDSAYFISNGSLGWYRLSPTAAPETGFTWSPNGQFAPGVQSVINLGCMKSIETSPGVKQLLVGNISNGPILFRDLNTFTDTGVGYPAGVRIGSLVFAQSNQCAEIASITTTCKAVGSPPTVAILGDEISEIYPWSSGTLYAVGSKITDSNGNGQLMLGVSLSPTGHPFSSAPGTSGGSTPSWSTVAGNLTTDGSGSSFLVWQNLGPVQQVISSLFESLSQPVTDPPFLNQSVSLYSQRWYFSTLQQTAWMKHMQLQITWPSENFPNELLDYSIFGAIHTE